MTDPMTISTSTDEAQPVDGADAPIGDPAELGGPAQPDPDLMREVLCEVFPGIGAGMLPGETVEEVLTSLPVALEALRLSRRTYQQPDHIPAGPTSRSPMIDIDSLSPESKIRAGLAR